MIGNLVGVSKGDGSLECGDLTRLFYFLWNFQNKKKKESGVKPPHSKMTGAALRPGIWTIR